MSRGGVWQDLLTLNDILEVGIVVPAEISFYHD